MLLFPNKEQWRKWTLPSKLTAIGTYISILTLFFTFMIYIGNSYKDIQDRKPKNMITKYEWICKDILVLDSFLDAVYKTNKNEIIDEEFAGLTDSNEKVIIFFNTILVDGLLTYNFRKDNSYEIRSVFDKKRYISEYEIKNRNNVNYIVFKEKINDKIEISEVAILSLDEKNLIIEFEKKQKKIELIFIRK